MKAVQLYGYGDVDQLRFEEVLQPTPGADEILVKAESGSVNPIDWKVREGAMQKMMPLIFPVILGRDVAGEVVAVGAGVKDFHPGDKVLGLINKGYAEFVADKAAVFAPLPAGLHPAEAGVLPLVLTTGAQLIENGGWIKAGITVLITGALGSVGRTAAHVAKQHGAKVIAGVRAKQKKEAEDLGAAQVIALDDEHDLGGLHDLDAIADTVGGELPNKLAKKLKKGGVYATVLGQAPDDAAGIQLQHVFSRPDSARLKRLAEDTAGGSLAIPIAKRFKLSEIREAHQAGQKGVSGKILLTP